MKRNGTLERSAAMGQPPQKAFLEGNLVGLRPTQVYYGLGVGDRRLTVSRPTVPPLDDRGKKVIEKIVQLLG